MSIFKGKKLLNMLKSNISPAIGLMGSCSAVDPDWFTGVTSEPTKYTRRSNKNKSCKCLKNKRIKNKYRFTYSYSYSKTLLERNNEATLSIVSALFSAVLVGKIMKDIKGIMKNQSSLLCPIKRICSIFNISQKELSLLLKVSDVTVNRWASKRIDIPTPMLNTLNLLEENQKQKKQIEKYHLFFSTFNEIQKDFIK